MKLEPRVYKYRTNLSWTGEHKGDITSPDKPVLHVACPPEWGGHEGIWTPEDMFVGSVELCTMTTFLWLLDRQNMKIKSYKSSAVGTAKMVKKSFIFSDITVEPEVVVFEEEHKDKILQMFEDCKKWCIVSKSVISEVIIKPTVQVSD